MERLGWPSGEAGSSRKGIEHWGAAMEQGRIAAASVLTDLGVRTSVATPSAPPSRAVPSYSTYVHTTKLTILGWPSATATERPLLGTPGDPRFAVALLDTTGRITGAIGVGGAKAANAVKPLVATFAADFARTYAKNCVERKSR